MFITLKKARETVAPYVGKSGLCATDDRVRVRVLELVERLLHLGASGNLRKWCFTTCGGCFTAPPELDVPLKVNIEGWPERVWSKWYEFFEASTQDIGNLSGRPLSAPAGDVGLHEEPNEFFTVYDLPKGGARITAIAFDPADETNGAHLIIQGIDIAGNQIYTKHDGNPIHGELLQPKRSHPYYSASIFKKITGIQKTRSVNYVRLYWFNPITKEQGLLGQYRPDETNPSYRRFRVNSIDCADDKFAKISVIGRVRVLDHYHDNDLLPITNLTALREMALSEQASENEQTDKAGFHFRKAGMVLDQENEYRRTGHDGLDIGWETSPANMENLI